MKHRPVLLAPMEDVTDPVFRRLCRARGADICFTEFVNVDNLLDGCRSASRKIDLKPGDTPTAIQIYGSNPERLVEAARIAEAASPSFIDINCGCWIPRIVGRGAGAGWLRDPDAMVKMAERVVQSVSLPVTVKTRIGWDRETPGTLRELAQRLEQAGVAAITLHCRTAVMRHDGEADWTYAAQMASAVKIPVIVNGDVRTANDCKRALELTGCAGVMIGRGAMAHPWVFREARALLDRGVTLPPPTVEERFDLLREQLIHNVQARGESNGVQCVRRHLAGYFAGVPGGVELRARMNRTAGLSPTLEVLLEAEPRMREAMAAS